ncbi:hypothetical protein COO60DRAFT_576061 [Scenedesmus sp. NREL 46B-D3]|nr:hypothetical protein COO60DRAFT_576061 [Scenedesmus sp. NREL 46B-D3]
MLLQCSWKQRRQLLVIWECVCCTQQACDGRGMHRFAACASCGCSAVPQEGVASLLVGWELDASNSSTGAQYRLMRCAGRCLLVGVTC